jgi:hypothetical protein
MRRLGVSTHYMVEGFLSKLSSIAHLDDAMRQVIAGAFGVQGLRLLAAVPAFGFNVLLGRLLGAGGAGVYYRALTLTTIGTVVGKAGRR